FIFNNHDLRGNLLTNLNQVAPAVGMVRRTVTVGSPLTITYADKYIGCATTNITLNLPSAVGHPGKDLIFVDETGNASSSKPITISPTTGQKINGATSK